MSNIKNNKKRGRPSKNLTQENGNGSVKNETLKSRMDNLIKDVDSLGSNVISTDKNNTTEININDNNPIDKINMDKSVSWLEGEIEKLSLENERLTNENETLKKDYQKIRDQYSDSGNGRHQELVEKIKKIYDDLYLDGRNMYKKHGWTKINVDLNSILEKLKKSFNFL